ncbi:hypothetical protein [Haliea sp.]|uniref:hypothetical protein n=1 Tax=Haliea sp. TaxID=1932666 RepID=UPI003527778F
MDQQDEAQRNSEKVLMALDQISQTIDVMSSVVTRLRKYVQQQSTAKQGELQAEMRPDRVLH